LPAPGDIESERRSNHAPPATRAGGFDAPPAPPV